MCYIAAAMLAITAIAGAVSVAGQQQQARAVQKAANYNASIQKNNAVIAEQNVRQQQLMGMKEEEAQRIKIANMIGQQRALFGASGVSLGSGSALDVQAGTAYMGQEDLLTLRMNEKAAEDRLHKQGADFTNQAGLLIAEGKNARTAANYQSVSTGLGTVGSMLGTANNFGMFSGGGSAMSSGVNPLASSGGGYSGGGSMMLSRPTSLYS